mmetsp:Transcript_13902/g.60726  ORF Transcript_13902/g.60726 Transcript_13902/m.60726 type:complete len:86 (+) Transcript_13902:374-631(+)
MSTTELISQPEISASNKVAPENIPAILITRLVFHLKMSWLKLFIPLKTPPMLWTWLTSQSGMSVEPAAPQFATPEEQHFSPVGTS